MFPQTPRTRPPFASPTTLSGPLGWGRGPETYSRVGTAESPVDGIDGLARDLHVDDLGVLDLVCTSYGTGPYVIEHMHGPCTCVSFLDMLNYRGSGPLPTSEPHYHLTCSCPGISGTYYLNGYRRDGSNVWSLDRVFRIGRAKGQLGLFDV